VANTQDKMTEVAAFDRDGKFYKDQLEAELFKARIRRDVKRIVEDEERAAHAGDIEMQPAKVYDPLPMDTPELIPGLLPESGTAAIVGETNTGKSLIALEMGSSLLTGEKLWGAIQPNRTIDKIVYILGEHTCSTLQGLYHRTGLPHHGGFYLIGPEHLHPYKALVIGGVAQQIAIDRMLRWTEGAGLVVFDPLAGFVQGNGAENDNATMRTLVDAMSLIATKSGAACLVLSHMGKPTLDQQSGQEIRRTSYATRGATAVEDAMTHIFYLRKALNVKQSGDVEKFNLSVRKFKGNPANETFTLMRDPDTVRNTLLQTKAARTNGMSLENKLELAAKVQRVLENNPKFSTDTAMKMIADAEGVALDTVKRWLTGVVD
jgi:RecA-family ATPase